MENAWCSHCKTSISSIHAASGFPCPSCGNDRYLSIVPQDTLESRLADAERLMCLGSWLEASSIYESCSIFEDFTAADKTLALSLLEWRKQCANAAQSMIDDGLPFHEITNRLMEDFDEYAADWVLKKYKGLQP